MTIASTTNSVSYSGNSVSTAFATNFYFLLATDLVVTVTTGATVVTMLLNVDYTVSNAGNLAGGAVTMIVPPATGSTLKIRRNVPSTQLTDYVQDDPFPADSHERALDKLTMICQQLQTNIDNAVLASSINGQINTASNLGFGIGLYKQKVSVDLQFRSISSPANGTVGLAVVSDRIEIDVKKVLSLANNWTAGEQFLEYSIPLTAGGIDRAGWTAMIHNNVGSLNWDNMMAFRGHTYHDSNTLNTTGAIWGLVTECWTNHVGTTTMVGAELACISQYPNNFYYPVVGLNLVFKNRSDVATHPVAAVGDGCAYNDNSFALFISSQARPSGSGAAWAGVGSGWQTALRIGDPGYGSGLDWSAGTTSYVGAKKYSVIFDFTNIQDIVYGSGRDMAGGIPWLFLYRTGATYFGCRFNPQITTGAIELVASVPAAGGAGYAVNDLGTINNGTGGTYKVLGVTAGVVTSFSVLTNGTLYYTNAANPTTATSGGGTGFKINIEQVVGERLEYWRMTDPGNPAASGFRYGYVDFSYTPLADRGGAFLKAYP